MSTPFIFVSCGQYTPDEKRLGAGIVKIVESVTGLDAFFAEEVHDLDGLTNNILGALRDCAALIVVLHPRGEIVRPDGSKHVRASVWIEQEIAIAAYIRHSEHRQLPVIAFCHKSVSREGIRDLLHLNPILFSTEAEVLAALPELLAPWKTLPPTGILVELKSETYRMQDGHPIGRLLLCITNDTNARISTYDGILRVPINVLKHWANTRYRGQEGSDDPAYLQLRFDEKSTGPVMPHKTTQLYAIDYCWQCALAAGPLGASGNAQATVWADNRTYSAERSVMMASRPEVMP